MTSVIPTPNCQSYGEIRIVIIVLAHFRNITKLLSDFFLF